MRLVAAVRAGLTTDAPGLRCSTRDGVILASREPELLADGRIDSAHLDERAVRQTFHAVHAATAPTQLYLAEVQPLVHAVLRGENAACILLGGRQSGKTHAIVGSPQPDFRGALLCAARELLHAVADGAGGSTLQLSLLAVGSASVSDELQPVASLRGLVPTTVADGALLAVRGETRLRLRSWEEADQALRGALARHDTRRRAGVSAHGSDALPTLVYSLRLVPGSPGVGGSQAVPGGVAGGVALHFVELRTLPEAHAAKDTPVGHAHAALLSVLSARAERVHAERERRAPRAPHPAHARARGHRLGHVLGPALSECTHLLAIACVHSSLARVDETIATLRLAARLAERGPAGGACDGLATTLGLQSVRGVSAAGLAPNAGTAALRLRAPLHDEQPPQWAEDSGAQGELGEDGRLAPAPAEPRSPALPPPPAATPPAAMRSAVRSGLSAPIARARPAWRPPAGAAALLSASAGALDTLSRCLAGAAAPGRGATSLIGARMAAAELGGLAAALHAEAVAHAASAHALAGALADAEAEAEADAGRVGAALRQAARAQRIRNALAAFAHDAEAMSRVAVAGADGNLAADLRASLAAAGAGGGGGEQDPLAAVAGSADHGAQLGLGARHAEARVHRRAREGAEAEAAALRVQAKVWAGGAAAEHGGVRAAEARRESAEALDISRRSFARALDVARADAEEQRALAAAARADASELQLRLAHVQTGERFVPFWLRQRPPESQSG